jgi:DNA-binding CsgD family transcriptional regulator
MSRKTPSLARGVPPTLLELATQAQDSHAFRLALRPVLRDWVPFDAYCLNACDPVTRAITSSVGDGLSSEHARRLFALERSGTDVNQLAELGVSSPHVVTISAATEGAPHKSERMRTLFLPRGFVDELRAALALGDHVWGYLHLFRKGKAFRKQDVQRITEVAPLLALGLARSTVSPRGKKRALLQPELVELDGRGEILHGSAAARKILASMGESPAHHGVYAAKTGLAAGCCRSHTGEWLAFRRFDVGDRAVVLIDRARPDEVQRTTMLAFGLTARERQVAELLIAGLSNVQLAGELRIGLHTAKDHVKAVLRKTGANTRAELPRLLASGSAS